MTEVLSLLGAAVLVVPLFRFLRLGAVLGFLAAGMLIGPAGLALVTEVEAMRALAELGVVLLLFFIGIELKPARLWLMRQQVFGMGSVQVMVTGLLLTAVLLAVGVESGAALILGFGLALSSTAFVLQILTERRELSSAHGRPALAILLLQDLAVVPLLLLIPLLANPETTLSGDLGLAAVEALAEVMGVIVIGRYLLRPVLHQVAVHGSHEIFIATGLLLVFGTAVIIEHAGMSMAMGAFLAGLLISDSEFRHQIMADILPFRSLLLGLFFMSVGMAVDMGVLIDAPLRIGLMLLALLAIKITVLWVVARLFRVGRIASRRVALLLGQSGEFGFVLFGEAFYTGLLSSDIYQEVILVVALSMVMTPLLAARYNFQSVVEEEGEELAPTLEESDGRAEVIVAGFGRMGQRIVNLLRDAGVKYVAVEQRPALVKAGRAKGYSVFYGDAADPHLLESAGVAEAKMMVVAVDNADVVERLVVNVRRLYPQLPIFARGHSQARCEHLLKVGATEVSSENLEASLQLSRFALVEAGIDSDVAEQLLQDYRDNYYEYLSFRGSPDQSKSSSSG